MKILKSMFCSLILLACGSEKHETESSLNTLRVANNIGVVDLEKAKEKDLESALNALRVANKIGMIDLYNQLEDREWNSDFDLIFFNFIKFFLVIAIGFYW